MEGGVARVTQVLRCQGEPGPIMLHLKRAYRVCKLWPYWRRKTIKRFSFGKKCHFTANIFLLFIPPTWPPCTDSITPKPDPNLTHEKTLSVSIKINWKISREFQIFLQSYFGFQLFRIKMRTLGFAFCKSCLVRTEFFCWRKVTANFLIN